MMISWTLDRLQYATAYVCDTLGFQGMHGIGSGGVGEVVCVCVCGGGGGGGGGNFCLCRYEANPYSKVHWGQHGPHVGPMNLAIRVGYHNQIHLRISTDRLRKVELTQRDAALFHTLHMSQAKQSGNGQDDDQLHVEHNNVDMENRFSSLLQSH